MYTLATGFLQQSQHILINGVYMCANIESDVYVFLNYPLTEIHHSLTIHSEGVIIKKKIPDTHLQAFFNLINYVFSRPCSEFFAHIGPIAKSAAKRASTACKYICYRRPTE